MAGRLRCGEGDDQTSRVWVINHGQDWSYSWLIMLTDFTLRNGAFKINVKWQIVVVIVILQCQSGISWLPVTVKTKFNNIVQNSTCLRVKIVRTLSHYQVISVTISNLCICNLRPEETPVKPKLNKKLSKNYLSLIWPFVCWVDFNGAA